MSDDDGEIAATAEPAESKTGSRWLELALGGRGFSRSLTFHEPITPGRREYKLAFGPAAVLNLAFYPLALGVSGPAAGIGLVADVEQAVGTSSAVDPDGTFPAGATFPTSMHEFAAGLRYRVPVGDWQIAATVMGGEHAYWLTSSATADRNQLEIPNAVYHFVRGALDVRLAVTADFYLALAWATGTSSTKPVPSAASSPISVADLDADVGAGYAATRTIELRLQARVRRYFYDMHSIAGDAHIAGGAVDQYLSVAALLAVTLDRAP